MITHVQVRVLCSFVSQDAGQVLQGEWQRAAVLVLNIVCHCLHHQQHSLTFASSASLSNVCIRRGYHQAFGSDPAARVQKEQVRVVFIREFWFQGLRFRVQDLGFRVYLHVPLEMLV